MGREMPARALYCLAMHRPMRIHDRGRPPHPDILTPAEWEVLSHLRRGLNNAQIARERGTTRDAVKYHLANIRLKLGMQERDDLADWARRQQMRAKDPMMIVYVSDLNRALEFYRDGLGLPLVSDERPKADFIHLDCDGLRLGLHPWKDYRGPWPSTGKTSGETLAATFEKGWMPGTTLHLGVGDIEEACHAVQAAGGRVIRGPETKPWGMTLAEVCDPDGNTFELSADT